MKTVAKKPAATPMPKQAGAKVHRRSHVVERGETLSEIALRYGVTVAALRDANKIVDDKKLAAGQVLAIPGGNATATVPAKKQSAWEQIKSSF